MGGALLGGRAHRRVRGARRPVHRAVGEEHVQLRAAHPRTAFPPAGAAREADVNRRAVTLVAVLAVALLALPAVASSYVLSVATLILFFAYAGQAWNVMMGFAGQLSLGHSLYVGVGAYAAAGLFFHYGIGPWAGIWLADRALRGARRGDRLPRVPLRHLGRLLRAAHDRVRRVHAHRLRPHRLARRPGRALHQGGAARAARPRQSARPAGDVLLPDARAHRRRRSRSARGCSEAGPATTGRRSARTSRRRRRSASTRSAGRCSRWSSARR